MTERITRINVSKESSSYFLCVLNTTTNYYTILFSPGTIALYFSRVLVRECGRIGTGLNHSRGRGPHSSSSSSSTVHSSGRGEESKEEEEEEEEVFVAFLHLNPEIL